MDDTFFSEIERLPAQWKQYREHIPLFYRDIMFMFCRFPASLEYIQGILPSPRLNG